MQKKEPRHKNGRIYWQCSKCKKWLSEIDYYGDQRTPNKLKAQCKVCHSQSNKAREILNNALASGKIIKPTNCSQCGKIRKLTAHHPDYSKPIEVLWLCYECHGNK